MNVNLKDKITEAISKGFEFSSGIGHIPKLVELQHVDPKSMTVAMLRMNVLRHERFITGLTDMNDEDQKCVFGLSSFMVCMQDVNKSLQDEGVDLNTLHLMSVYDYYELLKSKLAPSIRTPTDQGMDQIRRMMYHSMVMALNSVLSYLDRSHDKYISEGPGNGQEIN